MIVGIPKGLLYCRYNEFAINFFKELGAEVICSENTNKEILNLGINNCVDEACLPIKIFHGHVASIKDKCDILFIPRIMRIKDKEYICPKFCGLPEMIINSFSDLPRIIKDPIYINSKSKLRHWAYKTGHNITNDLVKIKKAYTKALIAQRISSSGIKISGKNINVMLLGHPYLIYDEFLNMNLLKKLKAFNVGVITEEFVSDNNIENEIKSLYKKPFWSFARTMYGSSMYLYKTGQINGIIYLSSFACGIDSIVIELIKNKIFDFPFLVLKIDEHSGEAGYDTRIEAFIDLLERRQKNEINLSSFG